MSSSNPSAFQDLQRPTKGAARVSYSPRMPSYWQSHSTPPSSHRRAFTNLHAAPNISHFQKDLESYFLRPLRSQIGWSRIRSEMSALPALWSCILEITNPSPALLSWRLGRCHAVLQSKAFFANGAMHFKFVTGQNASMTPSSWAHRSTVGIDAFLQNWQFPSCRAM